MILDVRQTLKELLKEDFAEYNSLNSPDSIEDLTVPIFDLPNATDFDVNKASTCSGLQFNQKFEGTLPNPVAACVFHIAMHFFVVSKTSSLQMQCNVVYSCSNGMWQLGINHINDKKLGR